MSKGSEGVTFSGSGAPGFEIPQVKDEHNQLRARRSFVQVGLQCFLHCSSISHFLLNSSVLCGADLVALSEIQYVVICINSLAI